MSLINNSNLINFLDEQFLKKVPSKLTQKQSMIEKPIKKSIVQLPTVQSSSECDDTVCNTIESNPKEASSILNW